jgi:UDP-3-O-[3-hydroxymyristoyl] N-acetylglucosamine deacetylase
MQKTLSESVSSSGIGLFTGEEVSIRICPAKSDTGILFQRVDLPQKPVLPARLEFVEQTPRCTILSKEGVVVQTVEHILAALRACEVDNALIEISGPEIPIFDGSAAPFIELIEKGGIVTQEGVKRVLRVVSPICWTKGDVHIVALPSDEYRISYTLHYPHSEFIGTQYYSFSVSQESFKKEIAPCRTFSLYEEIAPMIDQGLIKGGSLENAVIIREGVVINPEGVPFPDAMVRHKILDMIGDLSLVGVPFLAHIVAIRSGHASNTAFARELLNHFKMEYS